jgi:hypothetical protein
MRHDGRILSEHRGVLGGLDPEAELLLHGSGVILAGECTTDTRLMSKGNWNPAVVDWVIRQEEDLCCLNLKDGSFVIAGENHVFDTWEHVNGGWNRGRTSVKAMLTLEGQLLHDEWYLTHFPPEKVNPRVMRIMSVEDLGPITTVAIRIRDSLPFLDSNHIMHYGS